MNAQSRSPQPVVGYVTVITAVAAMICYSLLFWDDMPTQIITREAAGRHGASIVTRSVAAVVMPVTLVFCALLLMLMPAWNRLVNSTPLRSGLGRREFTRLWSTILAMLSVLMLALHVGIVDLFTGRGPQLPQLAAWAMAALLIGLAVICQVQRMRARRAIVVTLVVGGVLVAALGYALPLVAMAVGTVVMLGAIVAVALNQLRGGPLG